MRHRLGAAVLVAALMLTGCGSAEERQEPAENAESESANVAPEDGAETQTANASAAEAKQPDAAADQGEAVTADAQAPAESEQEPAKEAKAKAEAEAKKETAAADKKPAAKSEKPKAAEQLAEANKETNEAVVGSILNKAAEEPAAAESENSATVHAVKEIRSLAKDLKQKAEAGSIEETVEIAGKIVQAWESAKADIEKDAPDVYPLLDERIVNLNTQIQASEIDLQAIIQNDYQIYQGFRQLADKLGIE